MAMRQIRKMLQKAITFFVTVLFATGYILCAEASARKNSAQEALQGALVAQVEAQEQKEPLRLESKYGLESLFESTRGRIIVWSKNLQSSQMMEAVRSFLFGKNVSNSLSGDYLALGHAEFVQAFPLASEIASRLTAHIQTEPILQRALLAHLRAGDIEKALPIAKKFKNKKNIHGFIARFLLAAQQLRNDKPKQARKTLGDLSGFGDFVRYSAPTYRFWIAYALNDSRGEMSALREIEQESLEDFAQLLRLYAALARGEKENVQQILREGANESNNLSFVWAQALHNAKNEKNAAALETLSPFKNHFQASSLFLDELHRRIALGGELEILPSKEKNKATFFLSRSLADLASSERSLGAKLMLARIAVETDPSSDYAKILLSEALGEFQQYDEATKVSSQVGKQSLYYRQSLLQQAELLRRQAKLQQKEPRLDKLEQALAILKNMQAERENEVMAWSYAGSFYRVAGRHKEAVPFFDKAVEIYRKKAKELPQNKRASYWRLFYERGISLEREGKWVQAEKDFLEALELSPEQPMVLNYLAYTWLDLENDEKYEEALKMLQRAVSLRQGSGAVADSLGWAYYRLQEYQEALEELEKAITFEPEDPTINDHLGDVYWKLGRLIEARYQWARVLVFENEDEELLKSVQQKLENGLSK